MNAPTKISTLPEALQKYAGKILDADSHEQMPAQVWEKEVGPIYEDLAHHWMNNGVDSSVEKNHPNVPGYEGDIMPIDMDTIWKHKGAAAPGAADISRRTAVMDVQGIKRQLMFSTGGTFGVYLTYLDKDYGYSQGLKHEDAKAYGHELIAAYNNWGIKVAKHSDRVRPVLPVVATSINALMDMTTNLVNNGIKAIWLPSGVLPGGVSCAHPDLDPFWDLLAKNKVVATLHGGLDSKIFGTDAWWDVPAFDGFKIFGEFRTDPWSTANTHTTSRNFLVTMILGGVFDRHPDLRFGVMELGADWVGAMCYNLDMWYSVDLGVMKGVPRTTYQLPMKPSDFVKRNVRVTPFDFEDVHKYVTHFDMGDVLCFASDYPHVEGGTNPIGKLYEKLKPLGEDVVEKFFVTNAEWVLPD